MLSLEVDIRLLCKINYPQPFLQIFAIGTICGRMSVHRKREDIGSR